MRGIASLIAYVLLMHVHNTHGHMTNGSTIYVPHLYIGLSQIFAVRQN